MPVTCLITSIRIIATKRHIRRITTELRIICRGWLIDYIRSNEYIVGFDGHAMRGHGDLPSVIVEHEVDLAQHLQVDRPN